MRLLSTPALAAATLIFACSARAQETARPPVVPADPRVLFATLPTGEAPWKLVESQARSDYSGGWMQVITTRSWVGMALPGGPIPKVRITLSDTGGYPGFNGIFLVPDSPYRGEVDGFPAIKDPGAGEGKESVYISVDGRFQIHIRTENLPPGSIKEWFRRVKTADLQALAARGGAGKLPNPLPMFIIDEMRPKLNRTWVVAWTDAETLDKANAAGLEDTGKP